MQSRLSLACARAKGALAAVAVAGAAAAENGSPHSAVPYLLEYTAPATCPEPGAVERQLAARVGRPPQPQDGESSHPTPGARGFRVVLTVDDGGTEAWLSLHDAAGHKLERHATSASCAELIDAMTLIAAVTLERGELAHEGELAAEGAATATPPEAAPLAPTESAPPSSATPPTAAAGRGTGDGTEAAGAATPPPRSTAPGLQVEGGLRVVAVSPVGPRPGLGPALFAGLVGPTRRGFALELRLGAYRATAPVVATDLGDAELRVSAARLELCVPHLVASRFELAPCAFGELGTFEAEGTRTLERQVVSLPWRALGAEGRLAVRLVGPLALEVELGLVAPLLHDRFFFRPDVEVHRIPAVGYSTNLGLRLRR